MYIVEGIETVNYRKDDREISGHRIYFSYDLPDADGNEGRACDAVYLSDEKFPVLPVQLGDAAYPVYNKYGRCIGFNPC